MNQKSYPMPKDVIDLVGGKDCGNFSLRFCRFVRTLDDKKEAKTSEWKSIRNAGNKLFQSEAAKDFMKRRDKLVDSLKAIKNEKNVLDWKGKTAHRLSIGFGDSGPMDTGITLHRLYGLPFIPSTAVKGVCRAWAHDELSSNVEKKEHDLLRRIFGTMKERGKVIFHDAFPSSIPKALFELDIINVHYQAYYQGESPPADYLSPLPIPFLTVSPNVEFRFIATSRDQELIDVLKKWLPRALTDCGIGAKTSLGYGIIEEVRFSKGGS